MEEIKAEQKPIEDAAGQDYAEPNVIPKEIEDLRNKCKKLAKDAKDIGKQIEQARKGPSKDLGKALDPIGKKLLDLDKSILELAQKLEKLGQKLLKNGEDLREKEKFTPELKPKFDKQGELLENIGGKLKKIGRNFEVIGDKMGSVGTKLGGDDGSKLSDYADELKDLGQKVTEKGGSVEELGIKIQKLEPNVKDSSIDKDLEDMEKALGEIGNDLEGIIKVRNLYTSVKGFTGFKNKARRVNSLRIKKNLLGK